MQEESRRKAQSIQTGASINKFSTMKNLGQKCAKCGKTNHSTQNHCPGGKNLNKSSGNRSTLQQGSKGKKKINKKGKGKGKATVPVSTNILTMENVPELSIVSMESINFSCYDQSETAEWFLDSGSTEHITPFKSNFIQYREFGQQQFAEIADEKCLKLEGFGTVVRHSVMQGHMPKIEICNMLYVPSASKQLYLLIAARQHNCKSETMRMGTIVTQNGTPFIIGKPKSGSLHTFDLILVKNWNENVQANIANTPSDYTLWHQRMGHAHHHMIKNLLKNTIGAPNQIIIAPTSACEGCEKGKSKRLPFPSSKLRAR